MFSFLYLFTKRGELSSSQWLYEGQAFTKKIIPFFYLGVFETPRLIHDFVSNHGKKMLTHYKFSLNYLENSI